MRVLIPSLVLALVLLAAPVQAGLRCGRELVHEGDLLQGADGVVVGSALVSVVEQFGSHPGLAQAIEEKARELSAPLRK